MQYCGLYHGGRTPNIARLRSRSPAYNRYMKRISLVAALLLLACCSAKNTSKNTKANRSANTDEPTIESAPLADAMTVQETAVQEAAAPSAVASDEVPWGDPGTVVSTGASVSVHARVHLRGDAANPEPVVDLGEAVSLVYAKQNTGPETMQVWHSGFWPNHRILVLDAAGKTPKMTEMGKSGLAAYSPRGSRDKNFEWQLKPGEVDESEGNYDLATLFTFTKVGRYSVQVEYEEEVRMSSNVLAFWLAPKGARALLEKLNGWDAEEAGVIERPDAYPGRIAAGESNGFIGTHKEALTKLGVTVRWDSRNQRYQIESITKR